MQILKNLPWLIITYLSLLLGVSGLLTWMVVTGNIPKATHSPPEAAGTAPGTATTTRAAEKVEKIYVVFFDEGLSRTEQRAVLARFPQVRFLDEGIFPGVMVVELPENPTATVEQLSGLDEVSMVLQQTPFMICH